MFICSILKLPWCKSLTLSHLWTNNELAVINTKVILLPKLMMFWCFVHLSFMLITVYIDNVWNVSKSVTCYTAEALNLPKLPYASTHLLRVQIMLWEIWAIIGIKPLEDQVLHRGRLMPSISTQSSMPFWGNSFTHHLLFQSQYLFYRCLDGCKDTRVPKKH